MATKPLKEDQMVRLVRNALLVAGQEMGKGDQWPVIKDTIEKIEQDWEALKIERAVDEELKTHMAEHIKGMEDSLHECSSEMQTKLRPQVQELRDVYEAYFTNIDKSAAMYDKSREPEHIIRMKEILSTLEKRNEE